MEAVAFKSRRPDSTNLRPGHQFGGQIPRNPGQRNGQNARVQKHNPGPENRRPQRSAPVGHDGLSPSALRAVSRARRADVLATRMAGGYLPGGGSMALTGTQRKHLEARLLEERTRVVDALARYNRATRDTVQQEPGDRGTDTADQERDVVNAARETAELAEIDAALERLYQRPEQYGRCERSGKPIPFERLDLVPWARTCD